MKKFSQLQGYKIIYIDLIIFLIIVSWFFPHFILIFFNHPASDDFHVAVPSSIWGPITTSMGWYMSWSARYSANILGALNPLSHHSIIGYRLCSFLVLLLFIFTFFIFFKTFFSIKKLYNFLFAILATAFFLGFTESLAESLYYGNGYICYSPGVCLFILSVSSWQWISFPKHWGELSVKNVIALGFQGTFIFLVAGFNELLMALSFCFWTFYLAYPIWKKKKVELSGLFFWICSGLGVLAVLLSPATFYRMEASQSFSRSFLWVSQEAFFSWLAWLGKLAVRPANWLFFLLISALPVKPFQNNFEKRDFYLSFGISVFLSWFFFFPSIKGEGMVQARSMNQFFSLLIFLITWNIILAKSTDFQLFPNWKSNLIQRNTKSLILLISLLVWISPNQKMAIRDLVSGEAAAYDQERMARMRTMEETPGDSVWVEPYKHFPTTFLISELGTGPGQWYDNVYAQYFGKKFVHLEPKN
jgi:hypothetical protein